MKYAILYKPTDEYVTFYDNGKAVLFTDSENKIREELADILFSDGGYDNLPDDFQIVMVESNTDGNEYIIEKQAIDNSSGIFVSRSTVDG